MKKYLPEIIGCLCSVLLLFVFTWLFGKESVRNHQLAIVFMSCLPMIIAIFEKFKGEDQE